MSSPKFYLEDLVVRACEEDDIPAITNIYRHAVENALGTFETDAPGEAEMKVRWRLILIAQCPYIVAEYSRRVVGYAYANSYRPGPAYRKTVENAVFIREGFYGRGIGSKLLLELLDAANDAGFRQMIAVIADSSNVAAIKLHEKRGFSPAGTLRSIGWKNDRWRDAVLMQTPLGPGDEAPLKS